jgi:tetratricopeptide (TPR) repeat protein
MTNEQKRGINFEIANSLIKGRSIDTIEANSALLAAISGKNTQVIVHLCMAVLLADQSDLEMIAPHLIIFTLMRTDTFAYEEDPFVSQIFRGAQLLLVCQKEDGREQIQKVLDRFEVESDRVEQEAMRTSMALLVYAKLLLSTPKFGALPNFGDLVRKLDVLLENQDSQLPPELLGEMALREMDGVPVAGFLFLNQARQIKLINELLPTFEFLNSCGQELRQKLLKPFSKPDFDEADFDVDMLVSGAWLTEHEASTIDPPSHSDVFARLEEFAKSWDHTDLAVCCRKYRVIIIDEYGGDKDQALAVLDEGLELYGKTNSELVRAKAKVLYRAEDHQGSLELSKALIEGDAPLSKTEKAFLGREAAISAEKQGDYETAMRYFLYGSSAAGNCNIADMAPMRVGLMADAALASWHAGDRETCLRDFIAVLNELNDIDPKSSLRAAHCHAVCRHVLLWLDQDATGEKRLTTDGEETKIYPGIVSNPEPHPEIGERHITPIEMAWYMLATVENNSFLELGITQKLETFLPKGTVFECQFLLTSSKMRKAFTLLDRVLFVAALRETVAEFAYVKEQGDYKNSFDIKNVTYSSPPVPTLEQQAGISDLTEQLVLCFVSNCIFAESVAELDQLIDALEEGQGFKVRKELLNSLRGHGSTTDYNTSVAALLVIHRHAIDQNGTLSPAQVFELALKALQVAGQTNNIRVVAKSAFEWLNAKWTFILEHQRFLLRCPAFHEKSINQVRTAESDSWIAKIIDLLQAILPTMGFQNENQLSRILNDIRKAKR